MFFAAVAIFTAILFVRALGDDEIRSGLFTYGLFAAAIAVGLWRMTRWGRSLALIMAIGNAGLGALSLLAVVLAERGDAVGPGVLLLLSLGAGYALSRSVFDLPQDIGVPLDD